MRRERVKRRNTKAPRRPRTKTRVEIHPGSCRSRAGDLEVAGRDQGSQRGNLRAPNAVERARASWRPPRMPLRLRRQRLMKRLRRNRSSWLTCPSSSRFRDWQPSVKPQSHKTRFPPLGLPKAQLVADPEQKYVAAKASRKRRRIASQVCGARTIDSVSELGVASGKLVES